MTQGVYLLRAVDPKVLERVCELLRSTHVVVRDEGNGTVSVRVPQARSPSHEQAELSGYVATWNALNPGSPVELVTRNDGL